MSDNPRGDMLFVNRAPGIVVHYGAHSSPFCYPDVAVKRPWLTTWFMTDVTCKRCKRGLRL
ncbi:MAG TPA: hypothetical protein VJB57_08870 [Dehalococcoidia bacterium]|nr:hypothetical protein [Dehalococcoidia bacterium]